MGALLRPYRHILVYVAIASFFLNILLLAPLIYMVQLFDRVFSSRSNDTLFWLTLITVIMLLFYLLIDWLRGRMLTSAGLLLDRLLGERVLRLVMEAANRPGQDKHSFLMRDAGLLRAFVSGQGLLALLDAPWMPFFLLIIYLFHPVLGVLAIFSAVLLFGLALLNSRISQRPLEQLQQATRKAANYVDVSLRNAEVVRAMGMFANLAQRWGIVNREALQLQQRAGRVTTLASSLSRFTRQIVQVAMLATGAYLVIDQHVTPGVMIAVTLILGRALAPMEQLIAGWKTIVEAHAAYQRLAAALPEDVQDTGIDLPPLRGALEADRVSFTLAPDRPALIKNVSFQLLPGEFLGLIGPSGSGKSTLLRLLTGVWIPQAGIVRYDGADIRQWKAHDLGAQLGYLPQDVELFPGTVGENISRMAATDSEAIIEAARKAGAHDMILRLSNGYATEVGAGGMALSGGQRQRIGLARAVYGNSRVIILDEPDANLDADGEIALATCLRQLKIAGISLLVVSHKRSLLAAADKLLVLADGAVAMFGPAQAVAAKLSQPSASRMKSVSV